MDALVGIKEIKGMYLVYGIYDIVLELESKDMDEVKEIVFSKVRNLNHGKNTVTLLTYEEEPVEEEQTARATGYFRVKATTSIKEERQGD